MDIGILSLPMASHVCLA